MNSPDEGAERLRVPPAERFAGDVREIDLSEMLAKLRAEPHASKHGHRQMTLYHRRPVGQVLFAFELGGRLESHSAHGLVTIHALEGRMVVEVTGERHELRAGRLLILNPDIEHAVEALDVAAMLLTVHMERDGEPG